MSRKKHKPKRKKRNRRGRPTAAEKPLSAAEKAQRQTAAFKHGMHAKNAMVRTAGPCVEKHCPLGDGFPCDARKLAESRGEALTWCVLNAVSDDGGATLEIVRHAFETGDLTRIQRELTSPLLAMQYRLAKHELERLMEQGGLTRGQPIVKGDEVIGHTAIEDPGVRAALRFLGNLGATMADQGATPMSKATHDREVSAADMLKWLQAEGVPA